MPARVVGGKLGTVVGQGYTSGIAGTGTYNASNNCIRNNLVSHGAIMEKIFQYKENFQKSI